MAQPYIIAGIDIGNSQVKVVVAKVDRQTGQPEIVGVGSAPSNGLRRGMVVDMKETVENICAAVQQAQAMAGVPIRRTYLAVNGLHIKTQVSRVSLRCLERTTKFLKMTLSGFCRQPRW